MAVPKRKVSKQKIRQRKASFNHKKAMPDASQCGNCGSSRLPHRVCPSCGFYKGRQVVSVEAA